MNLSWCGHLSGEVSQADPEHGLWGSQVSHLPEGLKGTLITLTRSQETPDICTCQPHPPSKGVGQGQVLLNKAHESRG